MKTFTLDIDVTYETTDGLEFQQRIYLELTRRDNFFRKREETLERFKKRNSVEIVECEVANHSEYNQWLAN